MYQIEGSPISNVLTSIVEGKRLRSSQFSTMFQYLLPTITDNLGKIYEIPFPDPDY
jgi:hypothetical protein